MTKVIPIRIIDSLIEEFRTNGYRNDYDTKDVREIFEWIKKQAKDSEELEI
jgi:hypothetical protein